MADLTGCIIALKRSSDGTAAVICQPNYRPLGQVMLGPSDSCHCCACQSVRSLLQLKSALNMYIKCRDVGLNTDEPDKLCDDRLGYSWQDAMRWATEQRVCTKSQLSHL